MSGAHGNPRITWSVRAYAILVHAYPLTFRQEFGQAMVQTFDDMARIAVRSGRLGLARLWKRTIADVLSSLVTSYVREPRGPMVMALVAVMAIHLATLTLSVAYGAGRFGEFYRAPAFNTEGVAGPVHEDVLMAAYNQALQGDFGRYRRLARAAGVMSAVLLGLGSALFGLWQRSVLHGAGLFAGGTVATVAALALLPTLWFPLDSYAVAEVWVRGGPAFLAAAIWLGVTALGRHRVVREFAEF